MKLPKKVQFDASSTRSFEKNPTNLGIPIRLSKGTNITKQEKGVYKDPEERKRMS